MSHSPKIVFVCGLLTVTAIWGFAVVSAQPPKAKPEKQLPDAKLDLELSTFMRMKLNASSEILEGLTTENSELVIKGARKLVEMRAAEKWQVQHDVMYKQFSGDFQRSAQGLLEAAEKENFDGAALKWIDTTMKCMECHKFVRGMRVADVGR